MNEYYLEWSWLVAEILKDWPQYILLEDAGGYS